MVEQSLLGHQLSGRGKKTRFTVLKKESYGAASYHDGHNQQSGEYKKRPGAGLGDGFEADLAVVQVVDDVVLLEQGDPGVEIERGIARVVVLDRNLVFGGDELVKISVCSAQGEAGEFKLRSFHQVHFALVVGL